TGTGRTAVEESLLGHIAVAADEESLPFYRAALEANRPRDKFQPKRRRMVVAALAFLADVRDSRAARVEIEPLLTHENPSVRGDAVEHFARIHLTDSQSLDELAGAILGAFSWDNDHLYEFAMTNDLHERRFTLPPDEVERMPLGLGVRR